jgi:hypothetical protein
MIRGVPSSEKLFIGEDLNGRVGIARRGFERVHGDFGYEKQNQEGEEILNFTVAYDLIVANTFFRKKKFHLITFNSGQTRARSILSLLEVRRDQTTWIIRLYLISVSSHNTSFWCLTFIFMYASREIEARKSRERSGGSSNVTLLRCLRIELL